MPAHIHAALMLQYAQDAQETETPWERWQSGLGSIWIDCEKDTFLFDSGMEYRRKPETIDINGYKVPKPMRVAPKRGTTYYVASLELEDLVTRYRWDDYSEEKYLLAAGLCHLTKEAATKHAEALLSFTKG